MNAPTTVPIPLDTRTFAEEMRHAAVLLREGRTSVPIDTGEGVADFLDAVAAGGPAECARVWSASVRVARALALDVTLRETADL